jgi:hypothetical protein
MALWREWPVPTVERYWQEEEQKEERNYRFHLSPDQRNNDFIVLKYRGVTF